MAEQIGMAVTSIRIQIGKDIGAKAILLKLGVCHRGRQCGH